MVYWTGRVDSDACERDVVKGRTAVVTPAAKTGLKVEFAAAVWNGSWPPASLGEIW